MKARLTRTDEERHATIQLVGAELHALRHTVDAMQNYHPWEDEGRIPTASEFYLRNAAFTTVLLRQRLLTEFLVGRPWKTPRWDRRDVAAVDFVADWDPSGDPDAASDFPATHWQHSHGWCVGFFNVSKQSTRPSRTHSAGMSKS